jgi:hypothetical protein
MYWKFFEQNRNDPSSMYHKARTHWNYSAIQARPQEPGSTLSNFKVGTEPYANIIMNTNPRNLITIRGIKKYDNDIIAHLQGMAPYAQVALDLTVIAGLTVLAVASVTQRGVQDINVISAVSVWFLAIGLIGHLSNMLRLLHVYLQYDKKGWYNDHEKAAHHRVYLALLLVVMLVYVWLAGLDSATTKSSHALTHQVWVAVWALGILCGTDLLEHIAGAFAPEKETDEDVSATTERFWLHLSTKNYYMAWLLVLALWVLHLHRAMGICEAAKGHFQTSECLFLWKQ